MKVRELLKALSKMPKESEVYLQAQDHLEYEYDGKCNMVWLIDFDNIPEDKKEVAMDLKGKIVMIRS